MTLEKAISRAFDRANLCGEDADIYYYMMQYAAIRNLPNAEQEKVYDRIAQGLGF